jgi:hypothetical protein
MKFVGTSLDVIEEHSGHFVHDMARERLVDRRRGEFRYAPLRPVRRTSDAMRRAQSY